MAKIVLKYLQIYRVRGKQFAYYRRGSARVRLRGEIGTDEWRAEYDRVHADFHRAVRGERPEKPHAGSFAALWQAYLGSGEFRRLVVGTQAGYRRLIEPMVQDFGHASIATLKRSHIIAWRDCLAETPRKANGLVAVMRLVLAWAVEREWRADNPAKDIKPLRYRRAPHRGWTDAEIAAMTAPSEAVRLPVLIALYTAQRLGDVLALRWADLSADTITLRQSKTGAELVIPVHAALRQAIAEAPRSDDTICTRPDGAAWKIDHFKHVFAASRKRLDLPTGLHFHGLRHSAASRLAEAGCSHAEIAAITGHKSLAMVSHYAAGARQKSLAKTAMGRLVEAAENSKVSRAK